MSRKKNERRKTFASHSPTTTQFHPTSLSLLIRNYTTRSSFPMKLQITFQTQFDDMENICKMSPSFLFPTQKARKLHNR
ncbi:CLUMA_CG009863, isoform A [Clunio marinus]|uniref:CLUMA_CG009863, isoform A n=1 Tax=Clunio marinus TaxID=568069 RepID=A0A1J1IAW4_9DIPT|nr:CLUMA_CG009863, isoform A [Clunio marinus]